MYWEKEVEEKETEEERFRVYIEEDKELRIDVPQENKVG